MKKFLGKLKQEKGEVSVEWALVAVLMAALVVGILIPGIRTGLSTAVTTINGYLVDASSSATTP